MATYKVTGTVTHPALVDPLDVDLSVEVPDPLPQPEPEPPPPDPEPEPEPEPDPEPEPNPDPPPGPTPDPPPEPQPGDPVVFFRDDIAADDAPWGFDEWICQLNKADVGDGHPEINISTQPDPTGGGADCLRLYSNPAGATDNWRNQVGVLGYREWRQAMEDHIRTGAPVYVSMEVFLPAAFQTSGQSSAWLSLMDWHVFRQGGGGWYHTNPGVMCNPDGSGTFRFSWGSSGYQPNSPYSSVGMPVGKWFTWEMGWQLTHQNDGTVSVWIDGELAHEQTNVRTAADTAQNQAIFYLKQYGQTRATGGWQMPLIRYVRNVKITDKRVT